MKSRLLHVQLASKDTAIWDRAVEIRRQQIESEKLIYVYLTLAVASAAARREQLSLSAHSLGGAGHGIHDDN